MYMSQLMQQDSSDMLEALFAGLSVFVGSLALVVGVLQLLSYRRRHLQSGNTNVYELEAIPPQVMADLLQDNAGLADTAIGLNCETHETDKVL